MYVARFARNRTTSQVDADYALADGYFLRPQAFARHEAVRAFLTINEVLRTSLSVLDTPFDTFRNRAVAFESCCCGALPPLHML